MHALPTEYYTSSAIFAREREHIFGQLWLFAGLKMMVAKSGAYYARDLAGIPIVLQNLGGEVGCFLNVCAHRNAKIQPDGFGTRGLVCGYHGWRYAIDGSVAQIPCEDTLFRFSPERRRDLRLKRYALREVGQLLFVNFAATPLPIEAQFGADMLEDLRKVSAYFDTDVIHGTSTHAYNWKLPGENLRDHLHPRFVHPQTLAPYFDFEPMFEAVPSLEAERATLRDVSFGGPEGRAKKDLSWPYWEQLERWPEATDFYYNWLLYPNLHIASPDGCRTFAIEQYDPLAADSTRLVQFALTTRRRGSIEFGDALLRGFMRSARVLLDEDARIMESVQQGLSRESPKMQLGSYETNLSRFTDVTMDLLHV